MLGRKKDSGPPKLEGRYKKLRETIDAIRNGQEPVRKQMARYERLFRGELWEQDKLKPYNSKPVVNLLFSTVMQTAPMLTDARPQQAVVARKPFLQKLAQSYTEGLKYAWDVCEMQRKMLHLVIYAMVKKVGWAQVMFDPLKRWGGELDVEVFDPEEFFMAPGYSDPWDAPMCGRVSSMPLSWIKERFGVTEVTPDSSVFDTKGEKAKAFKWGNAEDFELDAYFATVYQVWTKSDETMEDVIDAVTGKAATDEDGSKQKQKKFPNGKWTFFTTEQFLAEEPAIDDHGLAPFVPLYDYEIPNNAIGMGEADQIEGLIRCYNDMVQHAVDHAAKYNDPNWVLSNRAGIDVDDFKETVHNGGQVYTVDGYDIDIDKVARALEVPMPNQMIFQLIQFFPTVIEEITGVTDALKGLVGKKQRQSAVEVTSLIETGHTRTRQRVRNLEWTLKRIAYLMVRLMQQHYSEPRQMHWTDENGDINYGTLGNSRAQADAVMEARVSPDEREQYAEAPERVLPGSRQEIEDEEQYKELIRRMAVGETDPVYFEFDIEMQTDSSLPLDKQSKANMFFRLAEMQRIDTRTLLEHLQVPNVEEVMRRIQAEETAQQGQQAPQRRPMEGMRNE